MSQKRFRLGALVPSDFLPQLLALAQSIPAFAPLFRDAVRIGVVLDAQKVQQELRWRLGRREKSYARSGLHEAIASGVVIPFARNSLVQSVLDAFPNQFQEVRKNRRCRVLLRYRKTGLLISFIFARRTKTSRSWIIDTPREERKRTTLLALLDLHGSSIDTLCVFPSIPTEYKHLRVRKESGWFQSGTRVRDVSEFLQAVTLVRASSKG